MAKTKSKQQPAEPRPGNGNLIRIPWALVDVYEKEAERATKRAGVAGMRVPWSDIAVADMKAARGMADGTG